jgi:Mrp family chromosome partitioning ATPase
MLETEGLARGGGLGEVLVSGLPLVDAVIDLPTHAGRLRVLHAGLPPPNPSELLSSERMAGVLREAADAAEIVIVDSSPLLAVSDSVPLLRQVSGVVVLARLKRTTREAMRRFREIVRLAGGNVLGVVATDAPEPDEYGYGYASDHEQPVTPAMARVVDLGESVTPKRRIAAADVDVTRGER